MANHSFKLGSWRVEPDHNRIQQPGQTVTLEPRVMDLLTVMAEHPGKVLSKDQLVQWVWNNSVVSDSAITWTVSRLRRCLAEDGANIEYIVTVPKKGYRLEISPESITLTTEHTAQAEKANRRWLVRWWAAWLALGVIGLAVVILVVSSRNSQLPRPPRYAPIDANDFLPLTSMPGREEMGAFSQDGYLLAFAHKPDAGSSWDLYLLPLNEDRLFRLTDENGVQTTERRRSTRRPTPSRLTDTDDDNVWPAFSPRNRQLAYFRHADEHCELRLLTLSPSDLQPVQDEFLLDCHPDSTGRVVWHHDQDKILFSDRTSASSLHAIFSFDLLTGTRQQVTFPETGGLGDRHFSISSDGDLAVFRHTDQRETSIRIGQLSNLSLSEVLVLPYYAYAIDWTRDSGTIVFNNSDFRLVALQLESGEVLPLLTRQERIWHLSFVGAQDRLSFTSLPRRSSNIHRFDLDGSRSELVVRSSFVNRSATLSPRDNNLAFVSDRTGMPQIWQRQSNGDEQQLSDAREWQSFDFLQWSPDGQHILAASNGTAASIDLEQASFNVHSPPGQRIANPFWSRDGRHIYYLQLEQGNWKLMRIGVDDAPDSARKVVDTALIDVKTEIDTGTIYLFRADRSGLWQLNADNQQPQLVVDVDPASILGWQVAGNVLYTSMRENRSLALYRTDLSDDQRIHLLDLPATSDGQFSMDLAGGAIYLTVDQEIESNIIIQTGNNAF